MRDRKGIAPAGQPPYAHKKKLLKKLYFYSFDSSHKSVVVGPVLLSQYKKKAIPKTLEKGGIITQRMKKTGLDVPKHYKPHPYTAPAVAKTLPKMRGWWGGSLI